MQLQAPDDVWARIEALAHALPGGVVATDGDGTLWSGDVGEDMFNAFVEYGRVEPASLEAMRRDAREHSLSDAGSGPDIARRILAAYTEGRFPERRVCELMVWCFAGWTPDEVAAFARDVVETRGLAGRLHDELLRVLERVRGAGIDAVLVSASPVAVVLEAGARVGFDAGQIVAALPRTGGGVLLADVEHPIPYAEGKVQRLRERIGHDRLLYAAFGDNAFDVSLLASARVPVAVRPKPRLRERAGEVPGVVELSLTSPRPSSP
ncbi:MAG TPA: haloacid dehalogenase-like hydrolase [Polyangiaceae bacterium]|nr:haloacid dehalogenase-like hydrolase [Polyangiaceae bacterium]